MNSERELFEEECKILKYNGDMTRSNVGNFYIDDQTNWMWQMWLSSKNREGYKLVPVEPTYKQLDAIKNSCVAIQKADLSDLEAHRLYRDAIGAINE